MKTEQEIRVKLQNLEKKHLQLKEKAKKFDQMNNSSTGYVTTHNLYIIKANVIHAQIKILREILN